jgi:hypothetical protein
MGDDFIYSRARGNFFAGGKALSQGKAGGKMAATIQGQRSETKIRQTDNKGAGDEQDTKALEGKERSKKGEQ